MDAFAHVPGQIPLPPRSSSLVTNRAVEPDRRRASTLRLGFRERLDTDGDLQMRRIGNQSQDTCREPGSPSEVRHAGASRRTCDAFPVIHATDRLGPLNWDLVGPAGRVASVSVDPSSSAGDFPILFEAASCWDRGRIASRGALPGCDSGQAASARLTRMECRGRGIIHSALSRRGGGHMLPRRESDPRFPRHDPEVKRSAPIDKGVTAKALAVQELKRYRPCWHRTQCPPFGAAYSKLAPQHVNWLLIAPGRGVPDVATKIVGRTWGGGDFAWLKAKHPFSLLPITEKKNRVHAPLGVIEGDGASPHRR